MTVTAGTGGMASFAILARVLNADLGLDPPVDRRQVWAWHDRGTKNRLGEPFPAPVRELADRKRGQPGKEFSVREVLGWARGGLPARGIRE